MRNAQIEIADIVGQVDTLRQKLETELTQVRAQQSELARQIASLQRSVAAPPAPAEELSEEILLVLSAAVAAYLGRGARIRTAHYVHEGTSPWAQQGRAFIQASHALGNMGHD